MRYTNIIRLHVVMLAACLLVCPLLPARAADDFSGEVKIGKEASEQVAKDSKFIDDPELVKRVEMIGKALAGVATETEVPATYGKPTVAKFDYSFKILDDKEVNAFSLPGGFVYVNKGLIDAVRSDDELAGVISHEIAHIAHHHGMQLMKTQNKQMIGLAAALIAGAAIGAKGDDLGGLAQVISLISMAKLSAYGQEAEFDADRTAVAYLAGTDYNPVGMLTFMEGMARDEMRKPQVDYGIFTTHPPSYQRARELISELDKRGIEINRRLVAKCMRAQAKPIECSDSYAVYIDDAEIVRLASSGGESASTRAQRVAGNLGNALLAGARFHDVKIGGGGQYVVVMNQVVISPTAEDVALAGTPVDQITQSAATAIRKAFIKEVLDQAY